MRSTIATLAFALSLFAGTAEARAASLADLAFLKGNWTSDRSGFVIEENWTDGQAGVVIGQSRGAAMGGDRWGVAAILASAVLYAINLVIARVQAQVASPGEITFFQSGVTALLLALAAPWLATMPLGAAWGQLVIAACLSTASLLLLAWAYAHGDTGFLATSEYTSFVYAAVLGWAVFGERVSGWTLAGAAIIVAACLHAARRRDIGDSAVIGAAT